MVLFRNTFGNHPFFCEDTVFEHHDKTISTYCRHNTMFFIFDWDHDNFCIDTFDDTEQPLYLICQYTRRRLTLETDVLAGIEALLSAFAPELGEAHFGIPRSIFDYGICWSPSGSACSRREWLPSWTWAGWRCAFSFLDAMDTESPRTWFGGPSSLSPFAENHANGSILLDAAAERPNRPRPQGALPPRRGTIEVWPKPVPWGPQAVAPSAVDEYYQQMLKHQRVTGPTVSDRGYLYFNAFVLPVEIPAAEASRVPYPDLKSKERADAFYDVRITLDGHSKLRRHRHPAPLVSITRSWRQQQPPDLVVEFMVVYAGCKLHLVPIEWELVRACEHCHVQHRVARRIGQSRL